MIEKIVICLTFCISVVSLYYNVKNNKAVHYVNAVTKNRVDWLYKFRGYMSELFAMTTVGNSDLYARNTGSREEHFSEIEKIRNLIHMHLNFGDKIDEQISRCVDKLVDTHREIYNINCLFYKEGNETSLNLKQEDPIIYPVVGKIIANYFGKPEYTGDMFFPFSTSSRAMNHFYEEVTQYYNKDEITRGELLRHVRVYCKFEWNRIKEEAEGKRYKKDRQEVELNELYKTYDERNQNVNPSH